MGSMSDYKVKITGLRTFDPKEIPEVKALPEAKNLPACEIHKPGQEFIVHSDYKMPESFCQYA